MPKQYGLPGITHNGGNYQFGAIKHPSSSYTPPVRITPAIVPASNHTLQSWLTKGPTRAATTHYVVG